MNAANSLTMGTVCLVLSRTNENLCSSQPMMPAQCSHKLSEDEREDALTSCRIDFVGTSKATWEKNFPQARRTAFALDGCFGLTTDQCLFEVFYNITYLTGTFDMSVRICSSGSDDWRSTLTDVLSLESPFPSQLLRVHRIPKLGITRDTSKYCHCNGKWNVKICCPG